MTAPPKRNDISDLEAIRAIARGPKELWNLPYPDKVITAKLESLVRRKIANYGVSMSYPWLEKRGYDVLKAIDE